MRRPVKLDASPGLNRQDSESQLQSLVARTQCRDIPPVLTSLLRDRLKRAECGSKEKLVQRSIYREILFLYMTVSGQVDIGMYVCVCVSHNVQLYYVPLMKGKPLLIIMRSTILRSGESSDLTHTKWLLKE